MALRRGRDPRYNVDIWPGFVDALSTLLLAVIFMLVVFVLGQFFLGQLLQRRDEAVARLEASVARLQTQLSSERDTSADLQRSLGQLSVDLRLALGARDKLSIDLAAREGAIAALEGRLAEAGRRQAELTFELERREEAQASAEAATAELQAALNEVRQTIEADRRTVEVQLAQLVQLRRDIEALTRVRAELEGRVAALGATAASSAEERRRLLEELGAVRDRGAALEAELASSRERTMLAQRELQARELRLAELARQVPLLEAARDREAAVGQAAAQEMERLVLQVVALSTQLDRLTAVLGDRQAEIERQSGTITDLGQRLNLALASRVEELSRYRSDFFGKLRQVLGDREDVRIVGDRFVFQSEVLFRSGEAELGGEGREQLAKLATAFKEIIATLPSDLPWVLQVDGHTDRRPISTARFPSNWELSTARAISVARFLIAQGIPADRVAARGFAEFAPLEALESEDAYRRNRRIELKLTTR